MSFELTLLSQSWAGNDPEDRRDLCSHGMIYLKIGENEISNEDDGEWTVSTSALRLLLSALSDYTTDGMSPMILHCGQLTMAGCPISISWTVRHARNDVVISELKKQPSVDPNDLISYLAGSESMVVDKKTYVHSILRFSDSVAQFFEDSPERVIEDEDDRNEYDAFLDEFNSLRDRARAWLKQVE